MNLALNHLLCVPIFMTINLDNCMSDKNYTRQVLELLSTAREGMTRRQIFNALDDFEDLHVLAVQLSQMARRGSLIKDGRLDCATCGHTAMCYRISEDGRVKLRNYRLGEE